ncbi:MAG: hypothetical protein FJ306_08495 [Planctomycetes bacterium]|nr:hypothetical protein [Planctomycetota bacterium]
MTCLTTLISSELAPSCWYPCVNVRPVQPVVEKVFCRLVAWNTVATGPIVLRPNTCDKEVALVCITRMVNAA